MKYSIRKLDENAEIKEIGTIGIENDAVIGTGFGVKMIQNLQEEGIRYMKIVNGKRKLTEVLLSPETGYEVIEHLEIRNSSYLFVVRID